MSECLWGCKSKPAQRSKPREFKPKDAARIICAVLEKGYSRKDIAVAVGEKCGKELEDCDCEKLTELLRLSLKVMAIAIATISAVVLAKSPILRILSMLGGRKLIEDLTKTMQQLEDASNIIEGEFSRIEEPIVIRGE